MSDIISDADPLLKKSVEYSLQSNLDLQIQWIHVFKGNLGNTACIGVGHNWGFAFWTSGQQLIKNDCSSPYVWKLSNDKLLAFDFTKWRKGEPFCGNAGEMCVLLPVYNDFLWDDHYCSNTICPLCEYTPDEFDPIYVNL